MDEWIDVAAVVDIPPNHRSVIELDGTEVAVFNLGGEFFAIEDTCTHDGAEIASGRLEGHQIICPRHGARFCVKTGKALTAPAYEDLARFPIRVQDGMVQIRDDR
jgi:3-phenylpropionate/trans-cinnamate dioxygenase ferredoxin subunit